MTPELLAQRVVDLIGATAFPHLDPASALSLIALVLAGAGLVTLQDFSLGGGGRLPLLVTEPFPRVGALIGVVPVIGGMTDALSPRLRHYAEHPAVDALVLATTAPDTLLLPRAIDGVPVRTATLLGSPTAPRSGTG